VAFKTTMTASLRLAVFFYFADHFVSIRSQERKVLVNGLPFSHEYLNGFLAFLFGGINCYTHKSVALQGEVFVYSLSERVN